MQGISYAWNCFVCEGEMKPYFSKDFDGIAGLGIVDYCRCKNCGIVLSKTHLEMTEAQWEFMNLRYHHSFFSQDENPDDPRWQSRLNTQANTIAELASTGVLSKAMPWIDYGCGDGSLANLLTEKDLGTHKYDKYIKNGDHVVEREWRSLVFDMVICTSVFEHVRTIETLDEIVSRVFVSSGVLALHVMVREEIPKDPDWAYLLPVHCTFFTNKSMQILFDRWGFESSIYHPESRMWFWFKKDTEIINIFIANQSDIKYHYKRGFMDYWK